MQFKDVHFNTETGFVIFTFISGITMLLMYSIFSSTIPEELSEIKLAAREIIDEHIFNPVPNMQQNILLYLKRIETGKVTYICVYGLFRLTKSFILSAIAMIFTYDLLIINAFLD